MKIVHNVVYLRGFVGYLCHQHCGVGIHLSPVILIQQLGELHNYAHEIRENVSTTRQGNTNDHLVVNG